MVGLALSIGERGGSGGCAPARGAAVPWVLHDHTCGADAMTDPDTTADKSDPNDPAVLKRAMKAFRKRMKLTRLDDESRLGRSPMTGGKSSSVVAILPPRQYAPEVWAELVRQGKLKDTGNGFYELVED